MRISDAPYLDRDDAGRRLADALVRFRGSDVAIVALPRGGVPVAAVIAERLRAPLDILIVRKVGAPGNPELGLGAVAEGGVRFLDRRLIAELGVSAAEVDAEVRREEEEVAERSRKLRAGVPPLPLAGRSVILVDDGMATGGTVHAAVQAIRAQHPRRIILAVGVSSREAVASLRPLVDEIVCPLVPPMLFAVGEWYREFLPVSDAEVLRLLDRERAAVA